MFFAMHLSKFSFSPCGVKQIPINLMDVSSENRWSAVYHFFDYRTKMFNNLPHGLLAYSFSHLCTSKREDLDAETGRSTKRSAISLYTGGGDTVSFPLSRHARGSPQGSSKVRSCYWERWGSYHCRSPQASLNRGGHRRVVTVEPCCPAGYQLHLIVDLVLIEPAERLFQLHTAA